MENQETDEKPQPISGGAAAVASSPQPLAASMPAPDGSLATPPALQPAVIIVGFGLPGRFVAEVLDGRGIPYCVIELNPANAKSIASCGKHVVCGDSRNPDVLREAGIERAAILAVTLPDEKSVLEVLHIARQINRDIKMLARCNYTSTGIRAEKAGATQVVIGEQLVALEFARLVGHTL